jgi:hypothetical protein
VGQPFVARFERRRSAQIAGLAIVVLVALIAAAARLTGSAVPGLSFSFWGPLAALLLIAKIIFLLVGWRCPGCGGLLGPTYSPRYCASCGLAFRRAPRD